MYWHQKSSSFKQLAVIGFINLLIPIFGGWLVCFRNNALFSTVSHLSNSCPRSAMKIRPSAWCLSPHQKFGVREALLWGRRAWRQDTGCHPGLPGSYRLPRALEKSQGPCLSILSWAFSPLYSPITFCNWDSKLSNISLLPGFQDTDQTLSISSSLYSHGNGACGDPQAVQALR